MLSRSPIRPPGILSLVGTYANGGDDLRVHTVRQNITWAKQHDIGEASVEVPTNGFQGINTSPFELTSPPVLRRNKLMLPTAHGIIMRNDVPVEAYPYPRLFPVATGSARKAIPAAPDHSPATCPAELIATID